MPVYKRASRKNQFQDKFKRFKHPYQILTFLQTANEAQWKNFQDIAKDYLKGTTKPKHALKKRALQKIATQEPHTLQHDLVNDFQNKRSLDGGIATSISVISNELMHLLGIDRIRDEIFSVPKPQDLKLEQQMAF